MFNAVEFENIFKRRIENTHYILLWWVNHKGWCKYLLGTCEMNESLQDNDDKWANGECEIEIEVPKTSWL